MTVLSHWSQVADVTSKKSVPRHCPIIFKLNSKSKGDAYF